MDPGPDSGSTAVPADAAGERLDRFVADRVATSRNQVQHWIEADRVTVDGEVADASTRLDAGAVVAWSPPATESTPTVEPENGPLAVLFEDRHLVVVDKPAGLVVHPGAGHRTGTLVHRLLFHYPEIGDVGPDHRPGIVHRLDIDTSGALVVARTDEARRRLVEGFRRRRIDKRYLTIAYGVPAAASGLIELPLGRHPTRRTKRTVRPGGRSATSEYRVLGSVAGVSLFEVRIETGRTHQIRVHLKARNHPIVGDPIYGEARWKNLDDAVQTPLREFARPALHAWRIGFDHPATGDPVRVEAPVPADMRRLWRSVGGGEIDDRLDADDGA